QIGAVPGETCFHTCAGRDDTCPFCLAPKLWETNEPQQVEVEYRGTHYEGRWVPLTDDLYVHYIFDITERKRAEEELRKFKTISDRATYGAAISDMKGNLIYVNKAFAGMHGYTPDELAGKPLAIFHYGQQIGRINTLNEKLIREGNYSSEEVWHVKRDGSVFPALMNATVIEDDQTNSVFLSATAIDITELKVAEKALRDNEERFRLLYQKSPLGYQSLDENGNFIEVNSAWLELLGFERDEVIGHNFGEFLVPEEVGLFHKRFPKFKEVGETYGVQFTMVRKNKSRRIVEINGKVGYDKQENFVQTHCVLQDITERKQAEELLRKSEAELSTIYQNAPIIMLLIDEDCHVVKTNQAAQENAEIHHSQVNEFRCGDVLQCINRLKDPAGCGYSHDCEHCVLRNTIIDTFATKSTHYRVEAPVQINIDGQSVNFYYLVSTSLIKISEKSLVLVCIEDVTERKQAEESLKTQQFYLSKAQEIGSIGTWNLNIEKNILTWTDENYRIFGVPIGTELTYEIFINCVHPEDREYVDKKWMAALKNEPYDIEHRLIVDGKVKWVRERAEVYFDNQGQCIRGLGVTQDITSRKMQEQKVLNFQQLLRSLVSQLEASEEQERMRLAAVLHDQIGQPLIFLKMKLEMMQGTMESVETEEQIAELIKMLPPLIQEVQELNFDLGCPTLHQFGLDAALKELLSEEIEQKYDLKTTFTSDMVTKAINPETEAILYRSIRELLFNTVKHAQASLITVSITEQQDRIHIYVTDDGIGFDTTSLSSVMRKKGSYGLFSIQERLNYMGGNIDINSKVGHGTQITLWAPILQDPAQGDGT
ncbi:MAG: PAS domain S-box protein, partial [Planctomycetes bacterium]|nr:PAS domain S-box protein [Planctomycetota bacterium]